MISLWLCWNVAHKENIIWRPSNNRPKCGYKIIFTTVSQTAVYSGHSFDIYTFIQHTFCLYWEALNRPHGRHAKVIIGADIIHTTRRSQSAGEGIKKLKLGEEWGRETGLVPHWSLTDITIIQTNGNYSRNLQGAPQSIQKPPVFIPRMSGECQAANYYFVNS